MLSRSILLRRSEHILGDVNLSFFMMWITGASRADLVAIMSVVYIINHRGSHSHPMVIGGIPMREQSCDIESCCRCARSIGGYKFDWIGPWTHRDIFVPIGDHPGEHRRRIWESLPPIRRDHTRNQPWTSYAHS